MKRIRRCLASGTYSTGATTDLCASSGVVSVEQSSDSAVNSIPDGMVGCVVVPWSVRSLARSKPDRLMFEKISSLRWDI